MLLLTFLRDVATCIELSTPVNTTREIRTKFRVEFRVSRHEVEAFRKVVYVYIVLCVCVFFFLSCSSLGAGSFVM